mmetsp:Transcript_23177/g.30085  ORF Transcript_23177/g.30085 Transcript_23177/m.30085 type:complete len:142 (+) Transcript_23177:146-571(+)
MMLEMQSACKGDKKSMGDYQLLSTNEDEPYVFFNSEQEIPPFNPNEVAKPLKIYGRPQPHPGSKCCFFFSVSGFIFLGIIGILLSMDSPYLVVASPEGKTKPELAQNVYGAAMIYVVMMVISLYFWCKGIYFARLPTLEAK